MIANIPFLPQSTKELLVAGLLAGGQGRAGLHLLFHLGQGPGCLADRTKMRLAGPRMTCRWPPLLMATSWLR
jgi:hypothetical protein